MKKRSSILFRTTAFSWGVIIFTLFIFVYFIIPVQRRILVEVIRSKSEIIATSIGQVTASAIIAGDYSAAIEHCMSVIKERPSIRYIVITRKDGFSLIHTSGGWKRDNLNGIWRKIDPETGEIDKEPTGEFIESSLVNEKVFHYSYFLEYSGIDWGWIHIGVSLKEFYYSRKVAYIWTLSLALLALLVGFLASFVFARRLSNPILSLNRVTQRIAEGDLTVKAEISTGDELESLAVSFNSMTETLQQSSKKLKSMVNNLRDSNDQLRSAQVQLLQSAKMAAVGQLSAGVAHEIKNPLAIIQLCIESLDKKVSETDKEVKDLYEMIRNAGERANKVIVELLNFSRYTEIEMKTIDLHQVIEGAISLIHGTAKLREIVIEKHLEENEILIDGDKILLEQVFFNLFANAIDAIGREGKITVSTQTEKNLQRLKRSVIIKVSDTGPGIPQDIIGRIFEPFVTTKEQGKGTGLGLSTVYTILERHYGRIDVESEEGAGTTFIVVLPLTF